ncbi:MAG TPA: beta-L-arabinofuranosidase domain-containing protein, partial [Bacteroidales bacterium]|nr:beta-L-arabinofuranosidase domain-containing protein [Bacteroidales bacterium]
MERRPGLGLVTRNLKGSDVSEIGNGKMYEMLRNYVGLAKLYEVSGDMNFLNACLHAWKNIKDYHLNAAGGPRGGVGIHPECFNVGYMFSPYSLSETCASMDWVRLNEELLKITGRAEFADELEWSMYNAIPGAMFPDGEGWIYHSRVNGKRERTSPLACCSSSGPIALESFTSVMYYDGHGRIAVNLYAPSRNRFMVKGKELQVTQETGYPYSDTINVVISASEKIKVPVWLRIPEWAKNYAVFINGTKTDLTPVRDGYVQPGDEWEGETTVTLVFPRNLRMVEKNREYNEKGWYLDDTTRFVALEYGPFVLSSQLKDDEQDPSPVHLTTDDIQALAGTIARNDSSAFILDSLLFTPYYKTGERRNGVYRKVWFKKSGK